MSDSHHTATDKKPATPPAIPEEVGMISEESPLGVIKISHSVVARIVKLATLDVPGVIAISAGGFELSGIFKASKDSNAGITVEDDDQDDYHITIHVVLRFGIELAKTADRIQHVVRDQVHKMTNKNVARVDVFIDDVKMPEEEKTPLPESV